MIAVRQLPMDQARALFDYRDGKLYWRHPASGRRRDLMAFRYSGKRVRVNVGDEWFKAGVLVWNWHNGLAAGPVIHLDRDGTNCAIENLECLADFIEPQSSQAVGNFIEPQSSHSCPTCQQPVAAPTYDFIVQHLELQPLHARILKAVWDGGGHPVMAARIFGYIYEDDIDGGPSDQVMYSNFKVALCKLRARLEGSGIGIETAGYRKGFKLVMEGLKK